jgi:hypothetical protein
VIKGKEIDAYVFITLSAVAWVVTYYAYKVDTNWLAPLLSGMYTTLLWTRAFSEVMREDYGIVEIPEARVWRRR